MCVFSNKQSIYLSNLSKRLKLAKITKNIELNLEDLSKNLFISIRKMIITFIYIVIV